MYKTISKRMQGTNTKVLNPAAPLIRDHFCRLCKQWFTAEDYRKHQTVSGIRGDYTKSPLPTPPEPRRGRARIKYIRERIMRGKRP